MKRESQIVGEALDYLESRGDVFAWRNNTGGAELKGFHMRFGKRGSSDILGLRAPRGQFLALEGKTEKGRLRPEQKRFLDQVRAAGGIGEVFRSVEDLQRILGPVSTDVVRPPKRVFRGATPDPVPRGRGCGLLHCDGRFGGECSCRDLG